MIGHLDHLVLTTTDEVACLDFYTRVLGMTLENYQTALEGFRVRTASPFAGAWRT